MRLKYGGVERRPRVLSGQPRNDFLNLELLDPCGDHPECNRVRLLATANDHRHNQFSSKMGCMRHNRWSISLQGARTWWEILKLELNSYSLAAGLRRGASCGFGRSSARNRLAVVRRRSI